MPVTGSSRCLPIALLACCCCLSGCLFVHQNERIVRQAEPRQSVHFESRAAQEAFNDRALDSAARERAASEDRVTIPFLLHHSNRDMLSESAYYNDQIVTCDSNGDQIISEAEALAYNPRFRGKSGWSPTAATRTIAKETDEQPGANSFQAPIEQADFESTSDELPDDIDSTPDSLLSDGLGEMPEDVLDEAPDELPDDILDDAPAEMPGDLLDAAASDLSGDVPEEELGDELEWSPIEELADERTAFDE